MLDDFIPTMPPLPVSADSLLPDKDPMLDALSLPDLPGIYYLDYLKGLHEVLAPRNYFEIGVMQGASLALARCPSIGVDPYFQVIPEHVRDMFSKQALHLYQLYSDDFFARHSPAAVFGSPVALAFLDGMHNCEFLLRDFLNIERDCAPDSVVVLHDCLPVEAGIATREQADSTAISPHRHSWWTGDVWRTSVLLRRVRPDLRIFVVDAPPTGLVLVTNLDPHSTVLADGYDGFVQEMLSWDLSEIGVQRHFNDMQVRSTSELTPAALKELLAGSASADHQ